MEHFRIIVLATALIGLSKHAFGQDAKTDNLTWTYNKIYNGRNQQEFASQGVLKTYPNDRVDWVQGTEVQTFSVTGKTGSWGDWHSPGSLEFTLKWDGTSGTLQVYKDATGTFAILQLNPAGRAPSYFKFFIMQITN
ncbi:MAG: hypothetical protein ACKOE6_15810 [Flammeovirgaceae bacterium]